MIHGKRKLIVTIIYLHLQFLTEIKIHCEKCIYINKALIIISIIYYIGHLPSDQLYSLIYQTFTISF